MLIVDKNGDDVCRDEFPVPQIDRTSKQVKEQYRRKFYLQSVAYGENSRFQTLKISKFVDD